jgi:hypothetical protein
MPGSSKRKGKQSDLFRGARAGLKRDQVQARLTHLVDKLLIEGGVPVTAKFSIDPNTYDHHQAFEFALGVAIKASSLMEPARQDLIAHLRWMAHTCRFLVNALKREDDGT